MQGQPLKIIEDVCNGSVSGYGGEWWWQWPPMTEPWDCCTTILLSWISAPNWRTGRTVTLFAELNSSLKYFEDLAG